MFTELNIIYPNKNCNQQILELLKNEKELFVKIKNCLNYSIYNDTYSNKIIFTIKWHSKEDMQIANEDFSKQRKRYKEKLMKFQQFPTEVFYLDQIC